MAEMCGSKGHKRQPDDHRMNEGRNHMRQQMILSITLAILLLLVEGVQSAGIAAPSSAIRSLTGVKAVRVVAEDLSSEMQKTGLRKGQLEGTAAEALRKNGF